MLNNSYKYSSIVLCSKNNWIRDNESTNRWCPIFLWNSYILHSKIESVSFKWAVFCLSPGPHYRQAPNTDRHTLQTRPHYRHPCVTWRHDITSNSHLTIRSPFSKIAFKRHISSFIWRMWVPHFSPKGAALTSFFIVCKIIINFKSIKTVFIKHIIFYTVLYRSKQTGLMRLKVFNIYLFYLYRRIEYWILS